MDRLYVFAKGDEGLLEDYNQICGGALAIETLHHIKPLISTSFDVGQSFYHWWNSERF